MTERVMFFFDGVDKPEIQTVEEVQQGRRGDDTCFLLFLAMQVGFPKEAKKIQIRNHVYKDCKRYHLGIHQTELLEIRYNYESFVDYDSVIDESENHCSRCGMEDPGWMDSETYELMCPACQYADEQPIFG